MYFNISKKHKRTLYFVIMYEYAIIGLKSPRFSVTQKPGIDIYIFICLFSLRGTTESESENSKL